MISLILKLWSSISRTHLLNHGHAYLLSYQSESPTSWNPSVHDHEDDHLHHGKKLSVLAKVKEKAKKWRQTLTKKKFGHDDNHTPSWGVALEDYEVEEEPENHGSLAYESQHAPKTSIENSKHQIADPLTSEKHSFSSDGQNHSDSQVRQKLPALKLRTTGPALCKSHSDHLVGSPSLSGVSINETPRALSLGNHLREKHPSPSKFTLNTLIAQRHSDKQKEKLPCPEMTAETIPTETNIAKEKEEHLSDGKATTQGVIDKATAFEGKEEPSSSKKANEQEEKQPLSPMKTIETDGVESSNATNIEQEQQSPTTKKTITEAVSEKLAPAYATVTEATSMITSKIQELSTVSPKSTGEERKWDKGVSVKEYLKTKLEPGEDERALSQVITEVISPRRSPSEKGVVEKVKTAVTMLLQTEEPSFSSSMNCSESSSQIPVSTNAHEVEEENQGRVQQDN